MEFHASILHLAKRLIRFLPLPGVVAALTYALALSRDVYPGLSAALTAEAAGLIPPSEAAHPIFALVTRMIASIDLFSLPVRLNLLSALCGTLCAMLLYHLISRLILFSACEDAGGGGREKAPELDQEEPALPAEVEEEAPALPAEVDAYNQRLLPIAIMGGLTAALFFIFMAPVWSAATRLDKGLFELFLALASFSLFPVLKNKFSHTRLALSAFLFVLGLFDSAVFVLLVPCYVYVVFRVFLVSDNRFSIMGCLMMAGMAGVVIAVYAYARNCTDTAAAMVGPTIISYAKALPFSHYRELRSFFPRSGWLLLLVQTGVPAIVLLFGKQILVKDRGIHTLMALLLVISVVVPGLLNLPIAPYFFLQPIGHLPIFGAAFLAAATAIAIASCLQSINLEPSAQESDLDQPSPQHRPVLRGLSKMLLPLFALMALVVPFRSFREVDTRRGHFADETARAMLDQMKGRTWLISNGYLDNHLLVQAATRKQPLTLVTLRPQALPHESEQLKRLIASSPDFEGQNRQRLLNALSLGSVRFVREWFMSDPEAGRRAMVFAMPDLWTSCGYVAVPEGLAFGGVRSDQKLDLTKIDEENRIFTGRILPLLQTTRASGYVAALQETLRMKAGLAANELGVLLEDQGKTEAAYQAYLRASEMDPRNLSAVLNGYALASAQKMKPEVLSRLSKKLNTLIAGRAYRNQEITGILQNYGTIRQPAFYQQQAKAWSVLGVNAVATDKSKRALALSEQTGVNALLENASFYIQSGDLVKAEACYHSALEKDPANKSALMGLCLQMLSQHKVSEAEVWLQKALDAGVEKDALLYPSVTLAILQKDTVRALALLEEATQKYPADLRYWTLKADILLEQGDLLQVEKYVLPQMQKALKNPDHFLTHAVRGFLLKKKGRPHYMEARNCLLRALSINAAMPDLWSVLFELDVALGKSEFTEKDTRSLLNIDPEHALANYLLGSLLLSRGKLLEAEDFLRRSLTKKPTSAACNDLAENLRCQKKLVEAEAFARQALSLEPGLLPALDTLASVLCDAGKHEEASQHAAKAVAANPKQPIYQLTLLRIQIKQGDDAGVKERLTVLSELQTAIPAEIQKEIEALKKNQKKG
jgi:tetratricopeptide (TPR) repeat protein